MELSTVGIEFHQGYHLQMICKTNLNNIPYFIDKLVYQMIFVKEGYGFIKLKDSTIFVSSPTVCCFNENDKPQLIDGSNLKFDIIYFQPWVINSAFKYENVKCFDATDKWLITPFTERTERYSGIISISHEIPVQITQLFKQLSVEIEVQADENWPCRCRSYLLETLILMWKFYSNYQCASVPILDNISDEGKQLIEYLHANYQNKITITEITKLFHINRTTLNIKFKSLTNTTIMEYLNKYRIEIASAVLRNTTLPINEVMARVGFLDDAHFWRTFKKYMNCSPSEYRQKNCWMLKKAL
ncbi:MAG: helix-turn-helix transcriptional regulator [Clostridiaceae bacterium]|nr:helix-turn-helix transcriptional regulator [Clostridiaceae bacterium]